MQSRWIKIEQLLREFQALLAPDVVQLNIENGIDCQATTKLAQQCPAIAQPGVYLIFDDSESLMYVGSSATEILYRVRKHRVGENFKRSPRWIDIIPFDRKWSFFVPALEFYLIRECQARGEKLENKVGTFPGIVRSLSQRVHQWSGS